METWSGPRESVGPILLECSSSFANNGHSLAKVDEYLDKAYGQRNGEDTRMAPVRSPEPIYEMVQWAHEELKADVAAEEIMPLPRDEARRKLVDAVDSRYRPEFREAERSLTLHFLDEAWKQHLYYMDHLRQGIGLVGYAQKDPKVEYKREGMKAFEGMWKGIAQQVTGSIFGSRGYQLSHPLDDYLNGTNRRDDFAGGDGGGAPSNRILWPQHTDKAGRTDPQPGRARRPQTRVPAAAARSSRIVT